ncbi:serine hydrolase domain-containing protein [Streptomyces sp. NPDC017941]|uniref:serine hydrolase domain-containing protein n=1 Tax=Streptomyces sp. NPDC017941 TaxID=3365018 RepID=UPI0037A01C9F
MSSVQRRVQEVIDGMVASGDERGVQVAVYQGGRLVVDAVAGVADPGSGRLVESGTPFYTYSMVKGAAATLAHIVGGRGLFGPDTFVAELWPEFGVRGKEKVTVRHVLDHTAGVPGIPLDTRVEDLCDWDRMCAAVADAELWWEPGTKVGYHAYTFGYIVGELLRRATGKPISQLLYEEIGVPLGIADEIYFGMPVEQHARLARLEDAPAPEAAEGGGEPAVDPDLPMFRSAPMATFPTAALGNRTDVLAADIPAGGKTTARAMARMYAALLGEVDGVRLLGSEQVDAATALSSSGTDEIFGVPTAWGLGYAIGGLSGELTEAGRAVFGVGGAGGTFAYADRARGIGFALAKNRLTHDFASSQKVIDVVEEELG